MASKAFGTADKRWEVHFIFFFYPFTCFHRFVDLSCAWACELYLVERSVHLLYFCKIWGMERMLPEIVQIISCVNIAIFSAGQKENMKMPCFMWREIWWKQMLTWTKVCKTFCACWLFKVECKSFSSCGNKLLKLWSYTVTAEQDIFLPDWEGRSHIAGGFIVSIVGGQENYWSHTCIFLMWSMRM